MATETPQSRIDTRALEIASKALARIESHEQVCNIENAHRRDEISKLEKTTEARFKELKETMTSSSHELKESIAALYGRHWAYATGVIVVLLTILGYVLTEGRPWAG